MEKLVFLFGLCFLFFVTSGVLALGAGCDNIAPYMFRSAWWCLAAVFVYIFKVVLFA